MTQVNVAITIDRNYPQHACVMLCSLFNSSPSCHFTVYIVTESFDTRDIKKLVRFIKKSGHVYEMLSFTVDSIRHLKFSLHATLANYYRLLIPQLLSANVKRVLYLDSDLIVKKDVKTFWEIDITGYCLAAIEDPLYRTSKHLELTGENIGFNSGVMLMNLEQWRSQQLSEQAIVYLEENPSLIKFWDQDALNAVLNGQWLKLPETWNVTGFYYDHQITEVIQDPAIIHFTGSHKPWHYHCAHPLKSEYFHYLKNTPWKNFRLEEDTFKHRAKQLVKQQINRITGRKIFNVYA